MRYGLLALTVALAACGGGAAPNAPVPSASASASAAPTTQASVVPNVVDASAPVAPASPAELRCEGRGCRVERANESTLGELAQTKPDLGELDILGGHPKSLAPLSALKKLYRFRIALCEGLADKDFAFAKGWSELSIFEVSNCDGFTSLAPLGTLPKLEDVAVINTSLHSLDGLRGAPLKKLRVQAGLTDLAAVESMSKLETLALTDLDGVHEAPWLPKLARLETLEINAVDFVRLPDLSPLTRLKSLTVMHCPKLVELKGLGALTALTTLVLDWTGIVDLSKLGKVDSVTFLHLEGTKVKDLGPLAAWKGLQTVIVSDDTPPSAIAALTKLRPGVGVKTARAAAAATMGPH